MNEQRTLRTMKAKEKMRKVGCAVGTAVATAAPFVAYSMAAPDPKAIVATFLGYVLDMFICVGALLVVWAVAQLALAFKNEDADSKSRAMMMLIVAAILIGISPLADAVLNGTGITPGAGFLGLRG